MLLQKVTTYFLTREYAESIATANQADSEGWTFRVVQMGACRFVIEVRDETGDLLGTL